MIIYCSRDLIFATKIRSTAEALGVASKPARDAGMLDDKIEMAGEAGPAAIMVDMDMGDDAIALIKQAKAKAGKSPVIAFGSHVATELLQAAGEAGADEVIPRSRFTALLPSLIQRAAEAEG